MLAIHSQFQAHFLLVALLQKHQLQQLAVAFGELAQNLVIKG